MTSWTVGHQAPLSMGFHRQEYWNGLPFPSSGDIPHQDPNLHLLHLQAGSLPLSHQGSPRTEIQNSYILSIYLHKQIRLSIVLISQNEQEKQQKVGETVFKPRSPDFKFSVISIMLQFPFQNLSFSLIAKRIYKLQDYKLNRTYITPFQVKCSKLGNQSQKDSHKPMIYLYSGYSKINT